MSSQQSVLLRMRQGGSPIFRYGATLWEPELYPEMIAQAWFPEDLATGAVPSWLSRGFYPLTAVQAVGVDQPTKLAGNDVLFAKDTGQNLSWGVQTNTPYINRWGVHISRCDIAGNPSQTADIPIVAINGFSGSGGMRQPYIRYKASTANLTMNITDSGGIKGHGATVGTAFADYNVLIWYLRGYQFHARINGIQQTPAAFVGMARNIFSSPSFFGECLGVDLKADIALNLQMVGQGEASDAFINRLEAWAFERAEKLLPSGHIYENNFPIVTSTSAAEDFPELYAHDAVAWAAFKALGGTEHYPNRGEPAPSTAGYSRVFFEGFTDAVNPVKSDYSGPKGSSLYAPGNSVDYGIDATLQPITSTDNYIYDPSGTGTLALVVDYNAGVWRSAGLSTVNLHGQGRSWVKGIWKMRFKITGFDGATPLDLAHPAAIPGLWYASPWTYNEDRNFWLTRNPIEFDIDEKAGGDQTYTSASLHVHNPIIAYPHPDVAVSDDFEKFVNYLMNTTVDPDFPGTIDTFDGNFHETYGQIEDDYVYTVVDGYETGRTPTFPAFLEPQFLLFVIHLADYQGDRAMLTTERFLFTIDSLEVWQKDTDLTIVPPEFSARPTIAVVGTTLTLTPNVDASQIQTYWYRNDGVPIVAATDALVYERVAADIGYKIRGYVRALSLVNRPFAWTVETATIT